MPFDAEPNIETLWAAFKDYLCKPYAANPEGAAEIAHWFDELYARRDNEKIELSYYLAEHETSGEKFHVFCLNGQIYFSDNAAVLTLPSARADDETDHFSDHRVGVWLRHHAPLDNTIKETIAADLAKLPIRNPETPRQEQRPNVKECDDFIRHFYIGDYHSPLAPAQAENIDEQPYLVKLIDVINDAIGMRGNANAVDPEAHVVELRVARDAPFAGFWHRDARHNQRKHLWGRTFIMPLIGPQTAFATGADENTVITNPPGTVASICYGYLKDANASWGVNHCPTANDQPRVNITTSTRSTPITGEPSPWRLTPAKLGAPVPA